MENEVWKMENGKKQEFEAPKPAIFETKDFGIFATPS